MERYARHAAPWVAALTVAIACDVRPAAPLDTEPDAAAPAPVPTPAPKPIPPSPMDAAVDASKLSPSFVYRDVNHVLGTGQSLSLGTIGSPPLSTTQPYANLTFTTGVISGGENLVGFEPLVEGSSAPQVETLSSSFANLVTKLAREELLAGEPEGRRSHDLLVSAHGANGAGYADLKKGTDPYAHGLAQVRAALYLATAQGKSYVVRAVTNVHGETDHIFQSTTYETDLEEWQSDYESDVQGITGQSDPIPMLVSQISSWTVYGQTVSRIPSDMLAAHVAKPGKIVLVGAKYHLAYAPDGVHLTNEGYRHMGEDYAKVYRRIVLEGKPWEPTRPKSIMRQGAVVTIQFHVPSPPLVLDSERVSDPGAYGFTFVDDGPTTPAIAEVRLVSADTVRLTLSASPSGPRPRVQYAFVGASGARGGPRTGPRGNLRDSDSTPSRNGEPLYNWCVHFEMSAP